MKSLNQLTKPEISKLIDACVKFDAGNILGPEHKDSEVSSYSAPEFGWKWKTKEEFASFINVTTGANSIAQANKILEQELVKAPEQPAPTTPGALGEQQEAERAAREEALKITKEDAERIVQERIAQIEKNVAKLREAEAALKKEKVYVKVDQKPSNVELDANEAQVFETIKKSVNNPKKFIDDAAAIIEERVSKSAPPEISREEIRMASKVAAYSVAEELSSKNAIESGNGDLVRIPYIQSRLVEKIQNPEYQKFTELTIQEKALKSLGEEYVRAAFGNKIADKIFEDTFEIYVSNTKQEGYVETDLSFGPSYRISQFSQESDFIKGLAVGSIKPQIYSSVARWVDVKASSLPINSTLSKLYSTEAVQLGLNSLKFGVPIEWVGTNTLGKIAVATGYGPTLGWFGKTTGWDLGVGISVDTYSAISGAKYAATATKIAITGGGMASEAFLDGAGVAMATGAKVAVQTGTKTGFFASITAALAPILGPLAPIASAIITFLGGEVISKLISKIWQKIGPKIKKYLPYIIAGILLPFFGPVAAIAGGLGTALLGGATVAGIGAGIGTFFWTLGRSTLITIGTPIIVTLLVFPVVVALILFIINSGAYVVPPSSFSSLKGYDNPYMSVTKTASPSEIDNPTGKTTVTYTIEITALKSSLTNVKISSTTCKVTKKNKSQTICPIENIPDIPLGTTISPASPYIFTFTANFDASLADSIVFDSIEISADTPEKPGITTSGSETVCVGDCPTSCVKVSDNAIVWPNSLRSNIESYTNGLDSEFPGFAAQVCANGEEINLCYNPPRIDPGYYAWHVHDQYGDNCDVYFNEKGVNNPGDAKFLTTHELTHHIQKINTESVRDYENSGAYAEVQKSGGFCSYSDTKGSNTESMAEAAGLYANIPSWGTCASPYKSNYPKNYIWAEDFMK